MNILFVNPPNSGRSIPEEKYGITSLKQIFKGEPLALEELAGNLRDHEVKILDLKVEDNGVDDPLDDILSDVLAEFSPDVIGITGVTCEANSMLRIAETCKKKSRAKVVVGGIHASNDPHFFNQEIIDYIITGIGKRVFNEMVEELEKDSEASLHLPGVHATTPGKALSLLPHCNVKEDLVEEIPPAYELVQHYRKHYVLERLGVNMGFVASAAGCPYRCSFCCIKGQTGGKYLTKSIDNVLRDIDCLGEIPVIRLVDANTFGDIERARNLAHALLSHARGKQFIADVRSDTVVNHPDLLNLWKKAGLRAVVVGFEEIDDRLLSTMNKANKAAINNEAIHILHDLEINIVGDFIISPEYDEGDFDRLASYLDRYPIDLPMITVMTPLPGTQLYQEKKDQITNHNLDYYTLTNAVTPTKLDEQKFYMLYADLIRSGHKAAKL